MRGSYRPRSLIQSAVVLVGSYVVGRIIRADPRGRRRERERTRERDGERVETPRDEAHMN